MNREENFIEINGKGLSSQEISEEYIRYMESGYNLSINEICIYLGCSYSYFINNFKDKIKYICINTVARNMLLEYIKQSQSDELIPLISKRLLYDRNDFFSFIKNNVKVEIKYKTFHISDFLKYSELQQFYDKSDKLVDLLNKSSLNLFGANEIATVLDSDFIPQKLYSMKELKKEMNCKHDMIIYRKIENLGVKKFMFFNLVRYDINDFNDKNVLLHYNAYIDLLNKGYYDGEIQKLIIDNI